MARRVPAFVRFLAGLPSFLRHPISLEEAEGRIRAQLETREASFAGIARRLIYGHHGSPYLPLLREARCELGDLEASVAGKGLEATLADLRRAGVYVAFDEFKGREPIVRGDLSYAVSPADFDNPRMRGGLQVSTGGSTGTGVPVWLSLPYLADRGASMAVGFWAHGILGAPTTSLREIPPAPSVGLLLEDAYFGQVHERWFAPALDRPPFSSRRSRSAVDLMLLTARASRVPLPRPEPVDVERPEAVVSWAVRRAGETGRAVVRTGISYALRTSLLADELGARLDGVTFVGAGEPVTPGKIAAIERTGARWFSNYTVSEAGRIGVACAEGVDATDVHFLRHANALVRHPRTVPEWGGIVESFHFTSLLPSAPKILLNVETDDFGVVERRPCGCPLERLGFDEHIRDIFSFRKLTGEGVTLLGADALRVVDVVLPERFGGAPSDYQLVEEEDERGFTRITVVVAPRIVLRRDEDVVEAVLEALAASNEGAGAGSIWRSAGAVRVARRDPEVTGRGKLKPIVSRKQPR